MRELEYAAPSSLAEAGRLLRDTEGAMALAGGTDVVVSRQHGKIAPALVVDLRRIPGLDEIRDEGAAVEVGALVTMTSLTRSPVIKEWFPALALAAGAIGCWQVRNRATLGGNLCNASPSADTLPPLLVYGATAVLSDGLGRREVPLEEFLVGPGKTALDRGEMLVALRITKAPPGLCTAYVRRAIRRSMDIPLVNVAVGVRRVDGLVTEARVALGAVASVPFRATEAEKVLVGRPPDTAAFAAAARAAAAAARPITDVRATAEYRDAMVEVFVRRALEKAMQPDGAASASAGEAAA